MKLIKLFLILVLLVFLVLELFTDYYVEKWIRVVAYLAIVILIIFDFSKKK